MNSFSAAIARFNNQPINDVLHIDRFSIDFIGEDDALTFFCYKITKKYFHFNLNEVNKSVVPLHILHELIEKKKIINVSIELHNKIGEVLTIIYLEDIILLKIKDLLKLDYSNSGILKIKVEYQYNKMKMYKDVLQFKKYQRKQKLEKINVRKN